MIKSTWMISLLLLVAVCGVSGASAYLGFRIGHEALKGVNQPENNPSQRLISSGQTDASNTETKTLIPFISEQEVLVEVYDQVYAEQQRLQRAVTQARSPDHSSPLSSPEDLDISPDSENISSPPLTTQNGKVALELALSKVTDGHFTLDLSLQNNSQEPVTFLYNFLKMTNDKGRLLSTQVGGLPNKIPADRQKYHGNLRIPLVLLEDSDTLSLQLEDYPERNISLEIQNIPIVR